MQFHGMIAARKGQMTTNGFHLAIDHATAELNEIDLQLQKLTRRKFQTEKILDCLKELVAESDPAAVATAGPTPEPLNHQAPAEIAPAPESTELETMLHQAAELQAPAQEPAAIEPPADAIAHPVHEPAVEHQGDPAPSAEFQNMNAYSDIDTKSAAGGPPPSVLISAVPRIRIGF
jgi:hypothetical protein